MTDVTFTNAFEPLACDDLTLIADADNPCPISLKGRTVTIGRDLSNDVVVKDRHVSSFHCRIAEERGVYRVTDLGSRNGTRINGVRVREGVLWHGVNLGLGRSTSLLCVSSDLLLESKGTSGLVGSCRTMKSLKAELARFAQRDTPILIEGESGTGKELVARAIHELAGAKEGRATNPAPLVTVNCGAMTADLALSDLFGHERGAFTGATAKRRGAFELAHSGTLFLDEVGELDPRVQTALLRTLETGTIRRVGGEHTKTVQVRLISATNRNLNAAVQMGSFRLDLFHRLAVLRLKVPPLRRRLDDIPELVETFLRRAGEHRGLDEDALDAMRAHSWPGNVRELRNVIERACALCRGSTITKRDLRFDGLGQESIDDDALAPLAMVRRFGSVTAASRAMGIPRTTLRDRIKKLTA